MKTPCFAKRKYDSNNIKNMVVPSFLEKLILL